jgi:hypothetical protein
MSSSVSSYLGRPTYFLMVLVLLLTVLCITFPAYVRNPVNIAAAACFTGSVPPPTSVAATADDDGDRRPPELSILVGVHTMAKKHSRRHLIRMAYALQQTPALRGAARVDVRFALCARPMAPEHRAFVALESQAYGDVLLFNCTENAEGGKTYDYFAGLPAMMLGGGGDEGVRPYDYVMKVDDDTYLRLDALVDTLRRAPREDMYYGVGLPFMDRKSPPFMLGMGYVLSWDLVQWIATSDMVRSQAKGTQKLNVFPACNEQLYLFFPTKPQSLRTSIDENNATIKFALTRSFLVSCEGHMFRKKYWPYFVKRNCPYASLKVLVKVNFFYLNL